MPHARSREAMQSYAAATPLPASVRALSLKQVVELTNLSKAYVYQLIARGLFPAPAKVGNKSIWDQREIEIWLEARFAERVRAPADASDAASDRNRQRSARRCA